MSTTSKDCNSLANWARQVLEHKHLHVAPGLGLLEMKGSPKNTQQLSMKTEEELEFGDLPDLDL